jgi:hypothetical protein
VDELMAALDGLAAEDLAPLFGPALLDRLRPLLAAQHRLAAEVARTVREAEVSGAAEVDGLKSMTSWLRGHGHLSDAQVARMVRIGRALVHLPAMAAAFAAGEVTGGQAAVIARVAEPEPLARAAEQGVDLGVVDELLTGVAKASSHVDTAKAVEHYLDRLDEDGPEPDPTEGRRLAIVKHADGSLTGRFDLDAVGGEKLQTALEALLQAGRAAGDDRTRSQQRADALVQLADNALAAGGLPTLRGHKPQIIVKDRPRRPGRPGHRPRCRGAGLRGNHLRRAGALAGLRRAGHPDRHGPRRDATGLRPQRPLGSAPRPSRRRGPRRGVRLRRLRSPDVLVRRPPPASVDQRRRDEPGKLRAAVRTTPHPGPPRLPGRTTTRRPLAHLATRWHRDPHRTPVHRPAARHRRLTRPQPRQHYCRQPTTPAPGHRPAAGCPCARADRGRPARRLRPGLRVAVAGQG